MHCIECGEKLALRFYENEGLIPYCPRCEKFKFPPFNSAVSMVVVNRAQDRILLAKHKQDEDYILFAGYIRKGETAEKAISREVREEIGLHAIKHKYMSSKYHDPRNVLMLNFIVVVNDEKALEIEPRELSEARWCTFDEAIELVRVNSTAKSFLINAINDLRHAKI